MFDSYAMNDFRAAFAASFDATPLRVIDTLSCRFFTTPPPLPPPLFRHCFDIADATLIFATLITPFFFFAAAVYFFELMLSMLRY